MFETEHKHTCRYQVIWSGDFWFSRRSAYNEGMSKAVSGRPPAGLKGLESLIEKCVLCAGCHAGCPTYSLSRMEHDSARGMVVLADAILKGDIEPDKSIARKFDHCLTCMNCVELCPAGADPVKVITAARSEIRLRLGGDAVSSRIFNRVLPNRKFLTVFAGLMAVASRLYRLLPPLEILPFVSRGRKKTIPDFHIRRLKDGYPEIVRPAKKPFMRAAYFTGCMADSVYHDAGRSIIEIMQSAGVEVILLKDEVCCGAPAWFAGDRESARKMAEKNFQLFTDCEADCIVTGCATCGSVLKEIYPQILGAKRAEAFSAKIIDFQKLLADRLWDRLDFINSADRPLTVTYHDPCHLSRGMKVTGEPRDILKRLPGVEFIEMENASACCGGAGGFAVKFFDDSLEIGRQKAESVKNSGAEVVATACPSCRMQLSELSGRFAPGVRVVHTASLVRERIRFS